MKITVYCDKEGILRYNPEGWPEEPKVFIADTEDELNTAHHEARNELTGSSWIKYNAALKKAKSESVPFEDSDGFLRGLCGEVVADSFYDVEIDGKICVVPKCQKPSEPIQVARIVKSELSGNSEQLP